MNYFITVVIIGIIIYYYSQKKKKPLIESIRSQKIDISRKIIREFDCFVTGHKSNQELLKVLKLDENIILKRDPDNEHDKNAVIVIGGSIGDLGYLKSDQAKQVAGFLDRDVDYDAYVKKIECDSDDKLFFVIIIVFYE